MTHQTYDPFTGNAPQATATASRSSRSSRSSVISPLGIRLVSGLVAPYLSVAAQRELQDRWGHGANTLFAQTREITRTLREHPALHAALGAWVRNHHLPADAATALGDLLDALPLDDEAAQAMLDQWAATHTHDMITSFPGQVQKDTTTVLASAVAMEDTWKCRTRESHVRFSESWGKGFEADLTPWSVSTTSDGDTVRAILDLTSGLKMHFAISTRGPEHAALLLETPEVFTTPPMAGSPFVTTRAVERPTEMLAFVAPEFTTTSTHDLKEDAHAWGLETMLAQGAPGLGDLPLSSVLQNAFIEVTHTGVKAAAVTAMMFRSANAMTPPPRPYEQTVVTLDEAFAYIIVAPDIETPLFTGIHAG